MTTLNNNKLKIDEVKELIKNITEDIKKEENLPTKVKAHPVVFLEYYQAKPVKERWKLVRLKQKMSMLAEPLVYLGLNYTKRNELFVFLAPFILSSIKDRIKDTDSHQLINIVLVTYHEIGHSYQRIKKEKYSYFEYICMIPIEDYIIFKNNQHYQKNHDDYLREIDANMFSINKTERFLKQNQLYFEAKDFVKKSKTKMAFQKKNFDFDKIWEEFYRIYSYETIQGILELDNEDLEILTDIFFKPNTDQYKTITEICHNKNYDVLDAEMFCRILTSKSFIKQLHIEKLTEPETNLMLEVIKNRLKEEIEKRNYNESIKQKQVINENLLKEAIDRNEKKIKQLNYIYEELKLRSTENWIEHQKSR